MKKLLALLLVIALAASFVACGKTDVAEDEKAPIENVETQAPAEDEKAPADDEKVETPTEKPEAKPEEKPAEKPQEKPEESPKTVGGKLVAEFKQKANSGSPLAIAEAIVNGGSLPFMAGAMEVEEGLLSGFDNFEVTGFKSGATFGPMIGSIPFIGYVFELADGVSASDFVAKLKNSANLRWNICVEAEEMATTIVGNKVFFVMCPKQFEE